MEKGKSKFSLFLYFLSVKKGGRGCLRVLLFPSGRETESSEKTSRVVVLPPPHVEGPLCLCCRQTRLCFLTKPFLRKKLSGVA